jgi:hypothetical protein
MYRALHTSQTPQTASSNTTFRKITNGGFEDGTTGWQSGDAILQTAEGGQSGKCLELNATGGAFQYAIQWNRGLLNKGELYELTFWAKSGSSGDEAFNVGIWDAADVKWVAAKAGKTTENWTPYVLRFVNTTRNPVSIELMKESPTKGTMLFDSVDLQSAGDNPLQNAEFELGTSSWAAGDADLTTIDGGHSGKCLALRATNGAFQFAIQGEIVLKAGARYDLSFWVKSGTSGDEPFKVGIWDPKASTWIASEEGRSTGTWVNHTIQFQNTSRNPVGVELVKNSNTPGTMLYDSITLKKHP